MLANFEGKGVFSASSLEIVVNGNSSGHFTLTGGTYAVNPDCTANIYTPTTTQFNGSSIYVTFDGAVLDKGGDEVEGSLYSIEPALTGTFDAKRVAEEKSGLE
jgi:hypothetical protein